jgi:hypothetical protein
MRILTIRNCILYTTTLYFSSCYLHAQDRNITLNQDPKFEQLLDEKRKINTTLAINDCYKIQIFSGESEKAKKILSEFKQDFGSIDATIIFNTPNYKEQNLIEVKKKYKTTLLIKPNR